MTLNGLDISKYQGAPDFAAVRSAGVAFVWIKSSEADSWPDPRFGGNWATAKLKGERRGPYHYFHQEMDPIAQARFCARIVGPLDAGDLPIALDVEQLNPSGVLVEKVLACLQELHSLTGVRPVLYASLNYFQAYLHDPRLAPYAKWVACYSQTMPEEAKGGFWQKSGSGHSAGVQGAVDLDTFDGDEAALENFVKDSRKPL